MPRNWATLTFAAIALIGCDDPATVAPRNVVATPAIVAPLEPADATTRDAATERIAQVDRLLDALQRRLALMTDVARAKWNAERPVVDLERERVVVENVTARIAESGVERAFAERVVNAQIQAARKLQQDAFDLWRSNGQGRFENVPDLASTQRPQIDAATDELIAALVAVEPWRTEPAFAALVRRRAPARLRSFGVVESVRAIAVEPLLVEPNASVPNSEPAAAAKDAP